MKLKQKCLILIDTLQNTNSKKKKTFNKVVNTTDDCKSNDTNVFFYFK